MAELNRGDGLGRREFLAASAGAAAAAMLLPGAGLEAAPAVPGGISPMGKPATAAELKQKLLECLGGPWPQPGDLRPIIRERVQKDGYRLEYVTYEVEPGDRVPAYLLVPDGVDAANPAPAVAVWHQHNGAYHLGKVEPAGLAGSEMHHTGVALAKLGYVVICPDAACFGERQHEKLKRGDYERFEFLRYVVAGRCLAWKNILDMRRAVDMLCARPEVRADRIGCYGHSMGSTHTWLVGPWEPRLRCLVGNCCLPTYGAIHRTHILHCFPNFIPGWLQYGDTPDIAGLIAPRRLHLNFGETDGGSPMPEVREGIKTIAAAYEAAGASPRFSSYIEAGAGHVLSEEMWRLARECFRSELG
jgi:dienelactone hydrolase